MDLDTNITFIFFREMKGSIEKSENFVRTRLYCALNSMTATYGSCSPQDPIEFYFEASKHPARSKQPFF